MSTPTEITFDEAAALIGCTPRYVRIIIKQHANLCTPIRYGHRTVKLALPEVLAVKSAIRESALRAVQSPALPRSQRRGQRPTRKGARQ